MAGAFLAGVDFLAGDFFLSPNLIPVIYLTKDLTLDFTPPPVDTAPDAKEPGNGAGFGAFDGIVVLALTGPRDVEPIVVYAICPFVIFIILYIKRKLINI